MVLSTMVLVHKKNAKPAGGRLDAEHRTNQLHQQPTITNRIQTVHLMCAIGLAFLGLLLCTSILVTKRTSVTDTRYLYWGPKIDCPGKHCDVCAGLGHQESSLRCALEEAMLLQRIFIMPSEMCISQQHNNKGILLRSSKLEHIEKNSWGHSNCSMDSLYDLKLISQTVRVILDTSAEWHQMFSQSDHPRSFIHVQGVNRKRLLEDPLYNRATVINRTASPLAWFVECKDRSNHGSVLLSHSFLPRMAASPLQEAAKQIITHLGDYDAIHVRRGDRLKLRKDRFGVNRTLFPHLNRDTQPHAIMRRISKWIPEGRTLFIASDERTPGFFDPLSLKYKVVFSSHFKEMLDIVVQNNYQLFMVERLVLMKAKTCVKTFKDEPSDLSLTDDAKKRIRTWEIPVYKFDDAPAPL